MAKEILRDTKKITGLVLFILLLTFFVKYPEIQEIRNQRIINGLIANQQYQEAYNLISTDKIDAFNFYFMSSLKCEIGLEYTRAGMRIFDLIEENRVDLLQELVDDMGLELGYYLIEIDNHVDGLNYNEEQKEELIQMHYQDGNMGRITELQGVEKVDSDFLFYLMFKGDFYRFDKYYDKVPEEMLETYEIYMSAALLHNTSELFMQSEDKAFDFLDEVVEMDFSERTLSTMGAYYGFYHEYTEFYDDGFDTIYNHRFFTENPYYNFYQSVFLLNDPKSREQALNDIKYNEEYIGLLGRDEIVHRVDNSKLCNPIKVTSGGILIHGDFQSTNYYDFENERYLELDNIHIFSKSPNGQYYLGNAWGQQLYLLDNKLDIIKVEEFVDVEHWIDNESFAYIKYQGYTHDWVVMQYNVLTGERKEYQRDNEKTLTVKPKVLDSLIWQIGSTTYTAIEPKDGENNQKRYYTVRNIHDHSEIEKIPFDFIFMGSCEKYIYGSDGSLPGAINVLVKMDKKSGEITELPFYSIFHFGDAIHRYSSAWNYNDDNQY